jgi:peptide/nickel transport system substrate-binding protein
MIQHRAKAASIVAVLALTAAACGSNSSSSTGKTTGGTTGGTTGAPTSGYNAGADSIVNASTKTGGTLKFGSSGDFDSTDPGDSYYAFVQDFQTYYARPLVSFKRAPGQAGTEIVGDLATDTGTVSDDGLTWTYHLRPGIKYEDGTPVKAADVVYAMERSNWGGEVLKNGPTYLASNLVENKTNYAGPFTDKDATHSVSGLTAPDDATVVIKLVRPFSDLPYVLTFAGSSPVPRSADKGADYKLHPLSVGPYTFDNYTPQKTLTLKKNPNFDPSTDPEHLHPQLLDGISVQLGMDQDDLDKQLMAGTIDVDLQGNGVNQAAQTQILNDSTLKKNADSAFSGREWYMQFNTQLKPFDDVHCRKAVEWLLDKVPLQNAYGGPVTGDIASTLMPPGFAGYQKFDDYPSANGDNKGNLPKAKAEMAQCSQPNGFSTVITARVERQHEIDAATSIKAQLAQLNIKADIQTFPKAKYFTNYAGSPAWANANNAGLFMGGWQPDWRDGYGMMDQIVTKDGIKQTGGGTNLSQFSNPEVEKLFAQAAAEKDPAKVAPLWGRIDKMNMDDATLVPIVYVKSLDFRPKQLTNVYVWQAYGIYDFSQLGLSR